MIVPVPLAEAAKTANLSPGRLQSLLAETGGSVMLIFHGRLGVDRIVATEWSDFTAIFPDHPILTDRLDSDFEGSVQLSPEGGIKPLEILRGATAWGRIADAKSEDGEVFIHLKGSFGPIVDMRDLENVIKQHALITGRLAALQTPATNRPKSADSKERDSMLRVIAALIDLASISVDKPHSAAKVLEKRMIKMRLTAPTKETIAKVIRAATELAGG